MHERAHTGPSHGTLFQVRGAPPLEDVVGELCETLGRASNVPVMWYPPATLVMRARRPYRVSVSVPAVGLPRPFAN